jgi:hypothetical protein
VTSARSCLAMHPTPSLREPELSSRRPAGMRRDELSVSVCLSPSQKTN